MAKTPGFATIPAPESGQAEAGQGLISRFPWLPENLRGRLRADAELKDSNWFRVGGPAELLFRPEDEADLSLFLRHMPPHIPLTILGVGSNLIIRDGGIPGVTIRLGRGFTSLRAEGTRIHAGAALLDKHLAEWAASQGLAGLEFFVGIPGTLGGAVAMNAGAYGGELVQVLEQATLVRRDGTVEHWPAEKFAMTYRKGHVPEGAIVTSAVLRASKGDPATILRRLDEIAANREATQPVRERTGGSTFKNPENHKAWELIDRAGCRGLTINGAQISEKHCNFMINTGHATAQDLEQLGDEVIRRVQAHSGITLEWEIKRIGQRLNQTHKTNDQTR